MGASCSCLNDDMHTPVRPVSLNHDEGLSNNTLHPAVVAHGGSDSAPTTAQFADDARAAVSNPLSVSDSDLQPHHNHHHDHHHQVHPSPAVEQLRSALRCTTTHTANNDAPGAVVDSATQVPATDAAVPPPQGTPPPLRSSLSSHHDATSPSAFRTDVTMTQSSVDPLEVFFVPARRPLLTELPPNAVRRPTVPGRPRLIASDDPPTAADMQAPVTPSEPSGFGPTSSDAPVVCSLPLCLLMNVDDANDSNDHATKGLLQTAPLRSGGAYEEMTGQQVAPPDGGDSTSSSICRTDDELLAVTRGEGDANNDDGDVRQHHDVTRRRGTLLGLEGNVSNASTSTSFHSEQMRDDPLDAPPGNWNDANVPSASSQVQLRARHSDDSSTSRSAARDPSLEPSLYSSSTALWSCAGRGSSGDDGLVQFDA